MAGRCQGVVALQYRREYNLAMQIDPQTRALFPRVYEIVRQVPRGRVTTYGDVAALVGPGCDARIVGYAMAVCPDDVPWQRVINAQGKISVRPGEGAQKQRMRLEAEGIVFDQRGRIDLKKYRWDATGEDDEPQQASLF
jgi:methylated-DNA-protein-cysteine methyltransferase-like protein